MPFSNIGEAIHANTLSLEPDACLIQKNRFLKVVTGKDDEINPYIVIRLGIPPTTLVLQYNGIGEDTLAQLTVFYYHENEFDPYNSQRLSFPNGHVITIADVFNSDNSYPGKVAIGKILNFGREGVLFGHKDSSTIDGIAPEPNPDPAPDFDPSPVLQE